MLGGWELQYSTKWLGMPLGEVTSEQCPERSEGVNHVISGGGMFQAEETDNAKA